jgi:hypothetical protein
MSESSNHSSSDLSTTSSRPWMLFWCLQGCDLLGKFQPKTNDVEWYRLWNIAGNRFQFRNHIPWLLNKMPCITQTAVSVVVVRNSTREALVEARGKWRMPPRRMPRFYPCVFWRPWPREETNPVNAPCPCWNGSGYLSTDRWSVCNNPLRVAIACITTEKSMSAPLTLSCVVPNSCKLWRRICVKIVWSILFVIVKPLMEVWGGGTLTTRLYYNNNTTCIEHTRSKQHPSEDGNIVSPRVRCRVWRTALGFLF